MEKSINSKPTHKQLMIQKQKLSNLLVNVFSAQVSVQKWTFRTGQQLETQKTTAPLLLALTEQFISDYIIKNMNKTSVSF